LVSSAQRRSCLGLSLNLLKMAASIIPFDPTITLGNVVNPLKFKELEAIGKLQMEIDTKQDQLNGLLAGKSSLDMIIQEVKAMKVDLSEAELKDASKAMDQEIKKVMKEYALVQMGNLPKIQTHKAKIATIGDHVESPMDYNKSLLKKDLPISSNTIKLNSQYFTFSQESQQSEASMAALKSFVSGETKFFGDTVGGKVSAAVQHQMTKQKELHEISGTLVVTATCTHANAAIFAPFVIDADKSIHAWNDTFSNKISMLTEEEMKKMAKETGESDKLHLVSGATYGSCFVGMVHTKKSESTEDTQRMLSTAQSMSANFDIGAFFASYSGGFGVDSSFSNDLKALLSSQMVSSHVSLVCEGCIPTITSNKVELGVKAFADFDPAQTMEKLATLNTQTNKANETVSSAADKARKGKEVTELRGNEIKNTMASLSKIDEGKDSVLNVNSLMSGLEDYVTQAKEAKTGVPINFFIKSLTRADIAKLWLDKYASKVPEKKAGSKPTPSGGNKGEAPKEEAANPE